MVRNCKRIIFWGINKNNCGFFINCRDTRTHYFVTGLSGSNREVWLSYQFTLFDSMQKISLQVSTKHGHGIFWALSTLDDFHTFLPECNPPIVHSYHKKAHSQQIIKLNCLISTTPTGGTWLNYITMVTSSRTILSSKNSLQVMLTTLSTAEVTIWLQNC